MADQLIQVVSFPNVAPAGVVVLPHNLNAGGRALVPDFIAPSAAGFTITATSSTVTVTNNNAGITSVFVWLEYKHTIQRAFGGVQNTALVPQPFVASGGGSASGSIPDPLTIQNLKLPSTFEVALAAGTTDPWIPASGWLPGQATICLHQRVSTFNSLVKCLPRPAVGIEPDVTIIVINAGDGGGSFTQTGILTMEYLAAAYDPGQGGDNSVYLPFYFPHQRNAHLLPGDAAFFRQDEGHESWRCIAMTQGGRIVWSIPDQLSLTGRFTFVAAAGAQQPNVAAWQTSTRMYVDTTAGAATFLGIAPPTPATWNATTAAFEPYGGDYRRIWNLGPNNLTLNNFDAGATPGWQFLQDIAGSIVLTPFQSIDMWYEPFGSGFWTINK